MLKRLFHCFFSRPSHQNSWLEIISWWEIRRIPYNLILVIAAAILLPVFYAFISFENDLKPGEDAIEPMAIFMAPIAANICYTAGWVLELCWLVVRKEKTYIGPCLLKLGVAFSLVIAAFPAVVWFIIWLTRII